MYKYLLLEAAGGCRRLPEADNTSCLWPSSIETFFDLVKQVKRNTVCKIIDSRYQMALLEWVEDAKYKKPVSEPGRSCVFLEAVCCKKQQKKVPEQLLACRIGDLWRT